MRKSSKQIPISITIQKGKPARLPFLRMKNEILGNEYELSVVFATPKLSQTLNKKWRGKNKPTNILSFALSETSGEIVIELETVAKQAPDFDMSERNFLGYLFIHGLLHLKGYEHGSTMESKEKFWKRKFGIRTT